MFDVHEFKQEVKEELAKYKSTIISTINEKVSKILAIPSCFEQNFKNWEKVIKYTDWKDKVKNTKQWLLSSLDYVYNFYNE